MKLKIAVASLMLAVTVPAMAQHGYHHFRHHRPYYGGGGNWVAPLIVGGVVGAVIANQSHAQTPAPVIVNPPSPVIYQPNCRTVTALEIDKNGNEVRYPITVCN